MRLLEGFPQDLPIQQACATLTMQNHPSCCLQARTLASLALWVCRKECGSVLSCKCPSRPHKSCHANFDLTTAVIVANHRSPTPRSPMTSNGSLSTVLGWKCLEGSALDFAAAVRVRSVQAMLFPGAGKNFVLNHTQFLTTPRGESSEIKSGLVAAHWPSLDHSIRPSGGKGGGIETCI